MSNWTLPESVLGITPFGEPDARLVAALCAAGAFGVLDLGVGDRRAREELALALKWVPGEFGVRFGAACSVDLAALPEQVTVVVFDGLPAMGDGVGRGRRALVEVTDLAQARAAIDAGADGLIARGNEAGGRVGELSSLVLIQQLLAEVESPVWLCGGIGPHTVAAAAIGGAAGVVLDSQLALLAESGVPHEVAAMIATMDGSETEVVAGRRVLRSRTPGDPSTRVVPIGQDGYLAGEFAVRYGDTASAVRAIRAPVADLTRVDLPDVLGPQGLLARRLGIGVPVVQGPMTRVSDRPELAVAVAEAGGLPMMALALSDADTTTRLLEATAERLGERPWGVGILGFAPEDVRAAQLAAIRRVRPGVVIIAGGRPGQAAALEEVGIAAFLHVPSPRLLGQFLAAGARRFVFEGSECGGHIGPRSSLCLWQAQISALSDFLDITPDAEIDVLFAGGIHDARSAAMVAAVAAPLAARGVGVGLLMGTAYLFTSEAVGSGAIGPVFQRQVLAASGTAVLRTAPGHSTRCVSSPFATEFAELRAELLADGVPEQQVWERLERLNVGRSRVASKGLRRDGDALVEVDEADQLASGLFMAGQVATLRSEATTVADLHTAVTTEASRLLVSQVGRLRARQPSSGVEPPPPLDIAIIGMACVFPGAPDMAAFWANILGGVDSVTEVPVDRWDPAVHYSSDTAAGERVPSKWGGFLDPVPFDALRYGIAPASLASIEPVQLLALEVAQRALADAGLAEHPAVRRSSVRDFDRERTSVVFGAESGGELANTATLRAMLPGYLHEMPAELSAQLPRFTEDIFPGVLANVIAGRIANRLDLGGANFTVDAACASSLAALDVACRELVGGTADLVLCGGADTHNGIYDYRLFASVGALSPTGRSRAFDRTADGIALSEGVGCVVLKRLDDAVRDGDRVYAVIKGIGSSSDGRSLGLTAPRPDGQRRAMTRAFGNARVTPADIGLVEAHGTGTSVGDRTELATLDAVFTEAGARPGGTVLGSVKSQIGHTKCAAGLAGLIKAALAIHTGTRPPTAQLNAPIGEWSPTLSPFAFNTEPRPWAEPPAQRHAGVSGFGFGGTNFHAVLAGQPGPAPRHGLDQWPAELFLLRGAEDVRWLRELLDSRPDARLRDFAVTASHRFDRVRGQAAIAVVARDLTELSAALAASAAGTDAPGLWIGAPPQTPPMVAVLFPGQGSQRVGMAADLFVAFPELQELFPSGHERVEAIYPGAAFDEDQAAAQRERMRDTRVAQPALGLAGLAGYGFLERAGFRADMLAGHSYGELVALAAAGTLAPADLFDVSVARAEAILAAAGVDPGTMAAVTGSAEQVERVLGDLAEVVIANRNSPAQVVISGPAKAVTAAVERLRAAGLSANLIPVACAFHSPVVADAAPMFARVLDGFRLHTPEIPIWSNRTAARYPTDPAVIRAELAAQLAAPVRFAEQIEAMYAAGARIFVECGPGKVLSGLVAATLRDRPHTTVRLESAGGGLPGALTALAELAVNGVELALSKLFHGRDARDLTGSVAPDQPRWLVDGQAVRTSDGRGLPGAATPAQRIALAPAAVDPDQMIETYLRGSRELVAAQRDVMLAYLGSNPAQAQALAPLPAPPVDNVAAAERPIGRAAPSMSMLDVVTSVISDRTGYPADMIEPGLDLEADLSIDSIKRTEIVGELATRVAADDERLGDTALEQLVKTRTAGGLADWLDQRFGTAAASPGSSAESAAVERTPAGAVPTGVAPTRFVLTPVPAEAMPAGTDRLAGQTFVISGNHAVGTVLRASLTAHGATVLDEPLSDDGAAGLIHLDALSPHPGDLTGQLDQFRAAVTAGLLISVAPTGGSPMPGMRGLVRSLAREHPDATVRLVEVDADRQAEDIARLVFTELLTPRDHPVVSVGDVRTAPTMTKADLGALGRTGAGPAGQGEAEAAALGLDHGSVLLMIGGARGITARFALTTAAATGCRIVVTGRTPLRTVSHPPAVAAATNLAGVRAALFAAGDRDHAEVDRTARRIMAGRQVEATLAQLRLLGGDVDHHPVDVTDEQALHTLFKQVHARYGRIDGVVFSAGVIEDRLFVDKTPDSFRRVFDTKVGGARTLLSAVDDLPRPPGFVVLFGSIAAVLGNRGQADYAAANDALDTIAGQWARRTGNRALTVHWGPWAPDVELGGMVTPELAADYARRGIELIDPEEGALSLLRELAWGDPAACSVVYTASGW